MDGRINMFAEADYSENSTAYMWIMNKTQQFADRILKNVRREISAHLTDGARHLTE